MLVMETEHCCKDPHPKLDPEEVIYIVGYDVSYEDSAKNAKCACVVLKLTRQREYLKRDRFLKQLVYIDDWPPPDQSKAQARRLKASGTDSAMTAAKPTSPSTLGSTGAGCWKI